MAELVADNVLRSCAVLYFHFFFGLALILLGFVVLASRIPCKPIQRTLLPWHAALGQLWVYGILIQISMSLYCRGDGFRPFIFGFLVILIVGQILGHASIRAYQRGMARLETEKQRNTAEGLAEMAQGLNTAPAARVCGCIPLRRLRTIHAVCMIFSFIMLFGAGAVFTIRSKNLATCKPFISVRGSLEAGAQIVARDGKLVMLPPNASSILEL